ncbi:MAG TPA: hypothetical protein VJ828_07455, partial [Lacipirellulaceae bacterium]|nr:hypothetical protein [Lacipirellulaceae bacterium]
VTVMFELVEMPALLDLFDFVPLLCGLIALPVEVGGWLFIWDDNGPPYEFMSSVVFNILIGLVSYALIGALVGVLIARKRSWRLGMRAMMISFTVIAVAIGLAIAVI